MQIGWPQAILLGLVILSLGFTIAKHGERQSDYNAFISITGAGIHLGLLYWGGFFG